MRPFAVTIFCAALLASGAAMASPELARQKICMGCHALDRKQVGPAFKDIAARYAGQKDAAARMADKIVRGGGGVWGPVPMPANPKLSADDAKRLADWILSLK
jgi:cytochrome c